MNFLLRMFSRKWLLTTVLVVLAAGVMVRLGFWQLDRLEQRRAFNARVLAQVDQPPLALDEETLQADLYNMEYRKVTVQGSYDHANQVALRNQAMNGQWGVRLITPLHVDGSDQVVLVDRGWIPAEGYTTGDWSQYDEPGEVVVRGVLRRSRSRPDFGRRVDPTPAPGDPPLKTWNNVYVEAIGRQMGLSLPPVYIQQAPDPAWTGYPIRTEPELNLTEGSHLGYAIQWFAFAALLALGYPFYIRNQEKESRKTPYVAPMPGEGSSLVDDPRSPH